LGGRRGCFKKKPGRGWKILNSKRGGKGPEIFCFEGKNFAPGDSEKKNPTAKSPQGESLNFKTNRPKGGKKFFSRNCGVFFKKTKKPGFFFPQGGPRGRGFLRGFLFWLPGSWGFFFGGGGGAARGERPIQSGGPGPLENDCFFFCLLAGGNFCETGGIFCFFYGKRDIGLV